MKIVLVYYSFSGNTRRVCEFLRDELCARGHDVSLTELRLKEEEKRFFSQGAAATSRATPELAVTDFSVERFDAVVLASPVWAFTFAPALRTFLRECRGLTGKRCACVLTCGAQLTSGNALKELESSAAEKGARVIFSAYVAGSKTRDRGYLSGRSSLLLGSLS
jgi:flavodoxin